MENTETNESTHILVENFFESLWKTGTNGYLTLFNKESRTTNFFSSDSLKENIPHILEVAEEIDIYFGLGLVGSNEIEGRGKLEDIIAIPGLWLDVDIGTENHSSENYPPNMDEAIEIINECPLEPTIAINSGYGLHIYWLFDKPWYFEKEEDRKKAQELSKSFQSFFISKAQKKGYKLDNTSDLARMLRVPYTINHKGGDKKEVAILESDDTNRYNIQQIEEFLNKDKEAKNYYPMEEEEKSRVTPILKKCIWFKHCKADSNILPEPEWYHMLTIVARCEDAKNKAIELSSNHPDFNEEATLKKLEHASSAPGPVTCKYIEENFTTNRNSKQIAYCKSCKYIGKITSPIQLGINNKATETIESHLPKEPIYKSWISLLQNSKYTIDEKGYLCGIFNGELYEIANFLARATKEIVRDDGVDTQRHFLIKGILEGGIRLPPVEIPAEEFAELNWILPHWGIKVNIMPLKNGKLLVRSAIQMLSKEVKVETKYTHIGWRKIEERWYYLHAGGCIGAENVKVEADRDLKGYILPKEDDNPVDSLKTSLELLEIAPIEVTLPLLALVYLAPLIEAFRQCKIEPNFLFGYLVKQEAEKLVLLHYFSVTLENIVKVHQPPLRILLMPLKRKDLTVRTVYY